MTAQPLSPDPDEARTLMLAKLQALGLDLNEVQAALTEVQGPEAEWTVATAVVEGLIRMRRDLPRSAITYAPYLEVLAAGLPDVCPCSCVHCAKTACSCRPGPMGHRGACSGARDEPGLDCSLRYPGLGAKLVREVEADDISDAAWWLERRGLKRIVARNAKRVEERRVQHTSDGRGAREQLIHASRWLFNWLEEKGKVDKNIATRVRLPSRPEGVARALDSAEFVEIYSVAVTTGHDPALDGLILRHLLIQGVRRGALLALTAGGLDVDTVGIRYWDAKRKQWRIRPTTRSHLADLIAHTITRGPRIPAPADAEPSVRRTGIAAIGDGDPVFYYPPVDTFDADGNFLSRQVHPLSRKRIEVLFVRVREHLEWADRRGLRCHDIRHTSGRLIYKAADQQMARLHLAHDASNSTDHYLTESMDELRKLKETLFEPPTDQAAADEAS